jgi:hypothetical protein
MNLGISSTQVSTWKRIKSQHLIAAAGIALAVSVTVAGVSIRDGSRSPSGPRVAPPAASQQQSRPAETLLYIVGSQADATSLYAAFNEAASLENDDAVRHVVVAGPGLGQAELYTLEGELYSALLAGVTIIDLRAPPADIRPATTTSGTSLTGMNVQEQSHPAFAFPSQDDMNVQEQSHPAFAFESGP